MISATIRRFYHMHGKSSFLETGWHLMLRIPDIRPDEFTKGDVSCFCGTVPVRVKREGVESGLTFSEMGELIAEKSALSQLVQYLKADEVQMIDARLLPSDRELFILNVLAGDECLDGGRSQSVTVPESGLKIIVKAVINLERFGTRDIARVRNWGIIISDRLYRVLVQIDFPAIAFTEIGAY